MILLSHEFSIPGLLMNLLLQSVNSLCDGERKKINKKFHNPFLTEETLKSKNTPLLETTKYSH